MSKANSTATAKPSKPTPAFPLFPHASGQWAKKIRGKLHYFGVWATPDAALENYTRQKEDLHTGRTPRQSTEGTTVKDAVNAFLNARKALVQNGELSPRTWDGYKLAGDLLVSHLGKARLVADLRPDDFADLRRKMEAKWGPHRLGNTLQSIRSIFKHAFESDLIDRPVRFGPLFKGPSKRTVRIHRAEQGVKLFTAEEIHKVLDAAGVQLKAMILLGINAGLGNSDCGQLPLLALDLDRGILDYPRPKTGVQRRAILWPETVQAIRDALAVRPSPKDEANAGLCFITKHGQRWSKDTSTSPVSQEFAKLLRGLKINGRNGLGFYTLRHVFRTVGDEARDAPACDFIMGHESTHMSTHYRESIGDKRLRAVAEHVRAWLFGKAKETGTLGEPR